MLAKSITKPIAVSAMFACGSIALAQPTAATDFTAGTVMEKMPAQDRYPYISGVVEGVAFARYISDGKRPDGMLCIYDWFYKDTPKTLDLIYVAFGDYPKFTPAAIITALADKKCPKS